MASLGKPYKWLHSYVAGDKVYCVHQAENADVIREHARVGGFPANLVAEVASVFDSTGPPRPPALDPLTGSPGHQCRAGPSRRLT